MNRRCSRIEAGLQLRSCSVRHHQAAKDCHRYGGGGLGWKGGGRRRINHDGHTQGRWHTKHGRGRRPSLRRHSSRPFGCRAGVASTHWRTEAGGACERIWGARRWHQRGTQARRARNHYWRAGCRVYCGTEVGGASRETEAGRASEHRWWAGCCTQRGAPGGRARNPCGRAVSCSRSRRTESRDDTGRRRRNRHGRWGVRGHSAGRRLRPKLCHRGRRRRGEGVLRGQPERRRRHSLLAGIPGGLTHGCWSAGGVRTRAQCRAARRLSSWTSSGP